MAGGATDVATDAVIGARLVCDRHLLVGRDSGVRTRDESALRAGPQLAFTVFTIQIQIQVWLSSLNSSSSDLNVRLGLF